MEAELREGAALRRTCSTMSCQATLIAVPGPDTQATARLLDRALARLDQLEQRWSRFLPDSDVSRLNAGRGLPVAVSADTITLVEAMCAGWRATDGSFDPTLLATLVEVGYARSRVDATRRTSLPAGAARRGDPDAIRLDRRRRVVQLPVGTTIDPGGIGKGLAADLVVAELLAAGVAGALVEIGGDLRVGGAPPTGRGGWRVDVDTAANDGPTRVELTDGGVATSTSRLRTWLDGTRTRHHLIDPATLDASDSDAVSCTVIAGTAAWAEAFTKVAFANSARAAIGILERHGLAASITTTHGIRLETPAWKEFAR